jgi:hypothetical protein
MLSLLIFITVAQVVLINANISFLWNYLNVVTLNILTEPQSLSSDCILTYSFPVYDNYEQWMHIVALRQYDSQKRSIVIWDVERPLFRIENTSARQGVISGTHSLLEAACFYR